MAIDGWDILKGVGNLFLDSLESQAHSASRSKNFSEEQRENYARFENGLREVRGKNKQEDDYWN